MSPGAFRGFDEPKRDTYESLKAEYDSIQNDIQTITNMNISEEAKQVPLKELRDQINAIRERMHDYIDKLKL